MLSDDIVFTDDLKKKHITKGNGYIGSKFPIAQTLVSYPKDTWTKEDIDFVSEKAAKRIADFIFEN